MAQRIGRKQLKHDEIAEAAFDLGHWIEARKRPLALGAGAVALVVIAVLAMVGAQERSARRVRERLAAAEQLFATAERGEFLNDDDLAAALAAFEDLSAAGPSSPHGAVALYYQAATLQKLGRIDDALTCLERLDAGSVPETLGAAAAALRAELLVAAGRPQQAVELLTALAAEERSALPADVALLELGLVEEQQGHAEAARRAFQRVLDEYPKSASASEARRRLGGP